MSYRTNIRPPPAGFKPLSASNVELLKHGLPPRPNAKSCPRLYATWHRILSQPLTFVPAQPRPLHPNEHIGHIPIHPQVASEGSGDDTPGRTWSGAVNNTLPSSDYLFTKVTGSWAVPRAYLPNWTWTGTGWSTSSDSATNSFISGTWVGLDGYHTSKDVLQAGTAQGCTVNADGSLEHDTYAWFEWAPDPPKSFEGFDVQPGESVTVQVGVKDPENPTEGYVFFCNESNCTYTSVNIDIPDKTTFVGDTAEWIIEGHKPKDEGYPTMSYVGTTFINDCTATATDTKTNDEIEKDLADALILEIIQDGTTLSYGQKENDKLLGIYSEQRTNLEEIDQSTSSGSNSGTNSDSE